MHQHYKDILDRIPEPPKWFDDAGVPRFDAFAPGDLADIYAREAALAEVSCQSCGTRFRVALTGSFAEPGLSLGDVIRLGRALYGDPPNVGCCPAGPTMNSEMHAIVEYWSRDCEIVLDWTRDPAFEGPVGEERREPPDTLAAVRGALVDGVATLRVACSSRPNRYDLAGRIVAALAADGRVLVTFPMSYVAMARWMIRGLVPDEDVGNWQDERRVTLVAFDRLAGLRLAAFGAMLVLAGPRTADAHPDPLRDEAEAKLAIEPSGGIRIELLLSHSRAVLAPDRVIDVAMRGD